MSGVYGRFPEEEKPMSTNRIAPDEEGAAAAAGSRRLRFPGVLQWEPWEFRLILWSVATGVVSLGALGWVVNIYLTP